jgi:hypothetical protein
LAGAASYAPASPSEHFLHGVARLEGLEQPIDTFAFGVKLGPALPHPWITAAVQDCDDLDPTRHEPIVNHITEPPNPRRADSWTDLAVYFGHGANPVERRQYLGRESSSGARTTLLEEQATVQNVLSGFRKDGYLYTHDSSPSNS